MKMERITIELPIVKIEQNSPIFNSDFAKEHYEVGLFIADDGVMRHMIHYDGNCVNAFPCPHDVIEKHLVERAIIDNDVIYHRDMEAIEERLAVLEKGSDLIIEMIKEKDKENKEDHTSMMNFWHELRLKKELGGCDNGTNVIDVAKAFAVISKPELIKELSK